MTYKVQNYKNYWENSYTYTKNSLYLHKFNGQNTISMKIVIDRAIPFIANILEPYAEVVYAEGADFTPELVRDADALIIRTRTRCNKALLEGSKVQYIATATIGFDHIDLDYCRANNICISTSAGCNARGVLQWIAASLALLAKREGFAPHERTLGIVGVGNVGKLVKEYAEAWGFRTICSDPPRQEREKLDFVSLEEVLCKADILTLHTPLDTSTFHLINSENISLLRSGATLINASRGEVVATEATKRQDITYAIDVWEGEPNINRELLDKAIITTPHIAGYSAQGKANATAMAVNAIAKHFGLPLQDWYPKGILHSTPRPISWQQMCDTIADYCDLDSESLALRNAPEKFEFLRNNYHYREEYF
jgi:erythronate-4-phosphate dehydrogenase